MYDKVRAPRQPFFHAISRIRSERATLRGLILLMLRAMRVHIVFECER